MQVKTTVSGKSFRYYISYTVLFIATACFSFLYFGILNKAFLRFDGIAEYLTVLTYWGETLRNFFTTLLATGKFVFPQWDFKIGLGADILTTMHWYVIGDPLNLFSIFIKPEHIERFYNFCVIFRIYASGISFLLYSRYQKLPAFSSLCAAFVYAFSGYTLFCAVRHTYFMNPMIYLPLLCIGIEKILKEDKPLWFILSTFFSCITNYYFFYILSILIFIYAVVRFFYIFPAFQIKNLGKYFGKTLLYYVIGVAMGAVTFLPNILGFFTSARAGNSVSVPLLYPPVHYIKLVLSTVSPVAVNSYTFLGFAVPAAPSVILCFLKKDKISQQLKIICCLFALFLCFPFFGHMFNGFNYVTNRWSFACAFLIAVLSAYIFPQLFSMSKKELLICTGIPLVLSIAVFGASFISEDLKREYLPSYIILFFFIFVLLFINTYKPGKIRNHKGKKAFILSSVLISVIVNANIRYSPKFLDYLAKFYDRGTAYAIINQNIDTAIKNLHDPVFFRYEQADKEYFNTAVVSGVNGTAYYWSENNTIVNEAFKQLGITKGNVQQRDGFDLRAVPDSLACVKYLIVPDKSNRPVPYNYDKLLTETKLNQSYTIYKNKNPLPLGFTYDSYIPAEEFEKLSSAEKQEVLLRSAVIYADNSRISLQKYDYSSKLVQPVYTVTSDSNIIFNAQENTIVVKKADAKMDLSFKGVPGTETYLTINKLYNIKDKNLSTNFIVSTPEGLLKYGKTGSDDDCLIFMGYYEEPLNTITVKFESRGTYRFSKFGVICQPMKNLNKDITALRQNRLSNISVKPNTISGNISLKKNKLLFLSIPYSTGWKAFVDGREQPLYRTQIMYTGLLLSSGAHSILLKYTTPFLKIAVLIMTAGWLLFFILVYRNKKY